MEANPMCYDCEKNICKSAPGLRCSNCSITVHLSKRCTGLAKKHLASLKAAPALGWTCAACLQEAQCCASPSIRGDGKHAAKRISLFRAKLLNTINKVVGNAVEHELARQKELLRLQKIQMDEDFQAINRTKEIIFRNITDLSNKYKNIEARLEIFEQRLDELEQEKLGNFLEIANVPNQSDAEAREVVNNIADTIDQSRSDIRRIRRLAAKHDQPAVILVKLINEDAHDKWVTAANAMRPLVAQVHPTETDNENIVHVREAMTKLKKQLLWEAQQELKVKHNFKYVRFWKGLVTACQHDNAPTYIIRALRDISSIVENMD